MLKSVNLVALQPFEFEGRSYVRDQVFEVRPVVAAALTRRRSARFATDEDRPTTESQQNRRMMDPISPAPTVETAKEAVVRSRRPRRKRRDIAKAPHNKADA